MSIPKYDVIAGQYGPRLILCSMWHSSVRNAMLKAGVRELELNYAKGWTGTSLQFLERGMPALESFEIIDWNIEDITSIHCLTQLRDLKVNTYCRTGIDFSAFPELASCSLEWRARSQSLFECSRLKKLWLNHYKGKTANKISRLSALEELSVLNSPLACIADLRRLKRLRTLELANLRTLDSLAGLESLSSLRFLSIYGCRKVRSIGPVASLFELRHLALNNTGEIETLEPVSGLESLEEIQLIESTSIVDGDLTVLLGLPRLRRVCFQNRRHYSHTTQELQALLDERRERPRT